MAAKSISQIIREIEPKFPNFTPSESSQIWYQIINRCQPHHCYNEISHYYAQCEEHNAKIMSIAQTEYARLQQHLDNPRCTVIPMSSLYAGTSVIGVSDVDFGIVIKNMTDQDVEIASSLIVPLGYTFTKKIYDYHCFTQTIDGIEFELKVRDYDTSLHVIKLHHYLDNHMCLTQKKQYTFIKHELSDSDPLGYDFIKFIFYNHALLEMDPKCEKLFVCP